MKLLPSWWRRNFLRAELFLALSLTSVLIAWMEFRNGTPYVEALLENRRATIYGTLTSITAALLGFLIATTAVVVGFSQSERLAILRESRYYPQLWRVLRSATRVLAVTTAFGVLALVWDRDNNPSSALLYVFVLSSLLAALRVARSVWILDRLIALVGNPSSREG